MVEEHYYKSQVCKLRSFCFLPGKSFSVGLTANVGGGGGATVVERFTTAAGFGVVLAAGGSGGGGRFKVA